MSDQVRMMLNCQRYMADTGESDLHQDVPMVEVCRCSRSDGQARSTKKGWGTAFGVEVREGALARVYTRTG